MECASAASRLRRSEEHTSELQSQSNLVCRLLQALHSFPTRRSSDLAAAESGQRSVRSDHPVARHDDRDRVGAVRHPHGPHRLRIVDPLRELQVADRLSIWNARQLLPDFVDRKSTRLNSSHSQISYAVSSKPSTLSLHDALPILPPPNPVNDPFDPITRWHGTMIAIGLAPFAIPTALTAFGLSIRFASSK